MKTRKNCWEVMGCERHPEGANTDQLGACPASIEKRADGINGGKNGGRACWAIAGTMCTGEVQGTFAKKFKDCVKCEFFNRVHAEQGKDLVPVHEILKKIE